MAQIEMFACNNPMVLKDTVNNWLKKNKVKVLGNIQYAIVQTKVVMPASETLEVKEVTEYSAMVTYESK